MWKSRCDNDHVTDVWMWKSRCDNDHVTDASMWKSRCQNSHVTDASMWKSRCDNDHVTDASMWKSRCDNDHVTDASMWKSRKQFRVLNLTRPSKRALNCLWLMIRLQGGNVNKSQLMKLFTHSAKWKGVRKVIPACRPRSELRSCVKFEGAVLGSPSLIVLMVSVDERQHRT